MFPTFYDAGAIQLHTWGLMVTLAFAAAFAVAHLRVRRVGVDPDRMVVMYLVIAGAGMLGARLLHFVFAETEAFFADPMLFFDVSRGGWAFYGGAIGGTVGASLYARWRALPVWKIADVLAPTVMLGYAVGRMGCFFAGCCHGGVCDNPVLGELVAFPAGEVLSVEGFPWVALRFTPGVGVGALRGEVLFPSQLLEISVGLLIFGLLSWAWAKWRWFDGHTLALLLVAYAAARAFTEQFRGDAVRGLHDLGVVTLSTSQLVSLGVLSVAAVIVALRWRTGVAPEQRFVPEEPVI